MNEGVFEKFTNTTTPSGLCIRSFLKTQSTI